MNNDLNIGKILLAGGFLFAGYKLSRYIENNYFKGKTEEEINTMIDDAFKQLKAYVDIVKDSSDILYETVQNLQSGYCNLSVNNITPQKIEKLISLTDNIYTISKNSPKILEPVDIIKTSLAGMINSGETNG